MPFSPSKLAYTILASLFLHGAVKITATGAVSRATNYQTCCETILEIHMIEMISVVNLIEHLMP
jgi:hypothetical protein